MTLPCGMKHMTWVMAHSGVVSHSAGPQIQERLGVLWTPTFNIKNYPLFYLKIKLNLKMSVNINFLHLLSFVGESALPNCAHLLACFLLHSHRLELLGGTSVFVCFSLFTDVTLSPLCPLCPPWQEKRFPSHWLENH